MSRLSTHLDQLRARREKAFGLFLTNGFPDPASTLPILSAAAESGADFIELGMPFSDPLAEGLPIQRSSARALGHGVTMADAFETAHQFRSRHEETPLLLMGYINPVLRYGASNFCRDARSSGVDGLILPDLPPEESGLVTEAAEAHGLDLVFLVAPNTPDARVRLVDQRSSGFVYAVSQAGLTGSDLKAQEAVGAYLKRLRPLVEDNPVLVGFGIKSHADAARLSQDTDGYIVGSAFINLVESVWDDEALGEDERLAAVRRFVHALKTGDQPAGVVRMDA